MCVRGPCSLVEPNLQIIQLILVLISPLTSCKCNITRIQSLRVIVLFDCPSHRPCSSTSLDITYHHACVILECLLRCCAVWLPKPQTSQLTLVLACVTSLEWNHFLPHAINPPLSKWRVAGRANFWGVYTTKMLWRLTSSENSTPSAKPSIPGHWCTNRDKGSIAFADAHTSKWRHINS